jgi:hypothetical protein
MISALTKAQEDQIPVYFKKWENIGYRTETVNKEKCNSAISFLYTKLLSKEAPKHIIYLDSPMAVQRAANLIDNTGYSSKETTAELENRINAELAMPRGKKSQKYFGWSINNLWWTGYYCFYNYILNELLPEKKPDFALFEEFTVHYANIPSLLMFDEICFVSDFPEEINLDANKRLHAERKYALVYRDGYGFCSLNGVRVPDSIGLKAAHEVSKEEVLRLTNTEQRAAAMRYVGLANFMDALNAKELDSYKDYKLYTIEIEGVRVGPYLYMVCPSTGRQFLEGVGDSSKFDNIDTTIKSCQDALKWRAVRASKNLMTKYNMEWKFHA